MSIAKKEQSYKENLLKNWLKDLFGMGRSNALNEKISVGGYKIESKCPFKKSNSNRPEEAYNRVFSKTVLADLLCLAIKKEKLGKFVEKVLEDCPVFELCRRDLNYDIPFQCKKNVSKNVSMCLANISMDDVKEIEFEEYCQSCPVKWLCEVLTYIESSNENYAVDFLLDKYKEYEKKKKKGILPPGKFEEDYIELYNNNDDDNLKKIHYAIRLLLMTQNFIKNDIENDIKKVKNIFVQYLFFKYQEQYLTNLYNHIANLPKFDSPTIYYWNVQTSYLELRDKIIESLRNTIPEINQEQLENLKDDEKKTWAEISEWYKNYKNIIEEQKKIDEYNNNPWHDIGYPVSALQEEKK